MIVAIPKETFPGEKRVALIPASLPPIIKAGLKVLVEAGAGEAAGHPDAIYVQRGAEIVATRAELFAQADVIVQVRTLGANPENGKSDLALMKPGQVIIGMGEPLTAHEANRALADRKVSLYALELIPRTTRAQVMDVLSSMATIAGYKAVLMGASTLPKMFPMLMTAAGTITPARVFIIGAGVAGLQAIATARKLGAMVQAYDIRPDVKEQILSLGAKFVEMPLETTGAQDAGGYAKAQGEEFYRKQRELMTKVIAESDLVITTAAVPGKKAPILVTKEMVARMQRGSVLVDLAAERGGNCELTRPGEVVIENGVTILGPVNIPATVANHASQLYAKNLSNFLLYLVTKEGQIKVDPNDDILRDTMVVQNGQIVHAALKSQAPSPEPVGASKA